MRRLVIVDHAPIHSSLGWGIALLIFALIVAAVLLLRVGIKENFDQTIATQRIMISFANAGQYYKEEYGTFPDGNLKEVTAALCGANTRKIVFLELSPHDYSSAGELIDQWHTPWHSVRGTSEEPLRVISAGPDRIFGTPDDLIYPRPQR